MTDEGLIALAQAIDMRGLPVLQQFEMENQVEGKKTALGLSAITYALIKGSPQLKAIGIYCGEEGDAFLQPMIKGMLRAAGRPGSIAT